MSANNNSAVVSPEEEQQRRLSSGVSRRADEVSSLPVDRDVVVENIPPPQEEAPLSVSSSTDVSLVTIYDAVGSRPATVVGSQKSRRSIIKEKSDPYLMHTLDQWRYGIQVTVTMAFTMLFLFVDDWNNKYFNADAIWISIGATTVIDQTIGATFTKTFDRIMSAIVSGLWMMMIVSILERAFPDDPKGREWGVYGTNPIISFILAWINAVFPLRYVLAPYAFSTLPVFEQAITLNADINRSVAFKLMNILLGISISTVVVFFVVPMTALTTLTRGLSSVMTRMANSLQKSILLNTGVISGITVEAYLQNTQLPIPQALRELSADQWNNESAGGPPPSTDQVWKEMNAAFKELTKLASSLRAAKYEFRILSKPHRLPIPLFTQTYNSISIIYTQVVSLLASLDLDPPVLNGPIGTLPDRRIRSSLNVEAAHLLFSVGGMELLEKHIHPTLFWGQRFVPDVIIAAGYASEVLRNLAKSVQNPKSGYSEKIATYMEAFTARVDSIQARQGAQQLRLSKIVGDCCQEKIVTTDHFFQVLNKYLSIEQDSYLSCSPAAREIFWKAYFLTHDRISITCQSLKYLHRSILECDNTVCALVNKLNESASIFEKFMFFRTRDNYAL